MPFYVFEFKVDDTPDDAFAQINSKDIVFHIRQIIGRLLILV
jgi:hypothetical protein